MDSTLEIIHWPDPRLKKLSKPVDTFDESLKTLVDRMFELMRQHRGVGLAAPQVGSNIRLFITNHTGQPADDRVYINPELSNPDEDEIGEEGCLSLPDIHCDVARSRRLKVRAQNLQGVWIEEQAEGLLARVWQHENDHLNGILLLDRMGPVKRLAYRRKLKELEEAYAQKQLNRNVRR
jgi:peptide deformylase